MEVEAPPRATLGCIQLPTDLTLDSEGPALVARIPGVRLRLQKLALDGDALDASTYASGRGQIERAAATLRPVGSLDVVGLACTSLAFTLGCGDVHRELAMAQPGAQVTDMASSLLAALEHTGARRVALLTPYVDELHEKNLALLREHNYEVARHQNLSLVTDEEISAIAPRSIRVLVESLDLIDADVIVIACSAFRACEPGFLDELEQSVGKPVLSSQQVFLWHMLRLAGIEDELAGYGSLFRRAPARTPASQSASPRREVADAYPSRVARPGLVERVDPVTCEASASSGPLSWEQVREFDARGVLTLRSVFDEAEVQTLLDTTNTLRGHYESLTYDELDRSTDMRVITERGGSLASGGDAPTLKSIWQIHLPPEHAPHMRQAAGLARRTVCDARLVEAARQLLGEDVYIHQSRINFQRGLSERSPGGTGFLWHQDFEQWHSEDGMPRMRAVSMAVLLEPAVAANGALMVMPGSHRKLIQAFGDSGDASRYGEGALSRGPQLPLGLLGSLADEHGIEHCVGGPGDVVLFDCNTIHGSHTNISPWGRCMFFAVYNAVSNVPAKTPFGTQTARPEHIGSHDPRFAGVALPALNQNLATSHSALVGYTTAIP